MTEVPPPKKMKKENKVKEKGKERPKKRRIKRTITALENLKSLLKPTSKEQILQFGSGLLPKSIQVHPE